MGLGGESKVSRLDEETRCKMVSRMGLDDGSEGLVVEHPVKPAKADKVVRRQGLDDESKASSLEGKTRW